MPQTYPSSTPLQLAASGDPGDVQEQAFTTIAASSSSAGIVMYVNFVVFGTPPNNDGTPPALPAVALMQDAVGQTYTAIPFNTGFTQVPTADPDPINPTQNAVVDVELVAGSSPGVYELQFSPENGYQLDGKLWKIQFTNGSGAPEQVTFIVDSANTTAAWLALPPSPFDFGQALGGGLTLAGPGGRHQAARRGADVHADGPRRQLRHGARRP